MTYLAHVFAGIGLFISVLFGYHPLAVMQSQTATSPSFNSWSTMTLPTTKRQGLWNNNGAVYQGKNPVTPAPDIATLETYNYPEGYDGPELIKDKSSVWIGWDKFSILANADPASLEPVFVTNALSTKPGGVARYLEDATHVWYLVGDTPPLLPGADPSSFSTLSPTPDDYAADATHVYYGGKVIAGADPATFVMLTGGSDFGYAKDKNQVYYAGKPLTGLDLATFNAYDYEVGYAGSAVATDKNNVWVNGTVLPDADPATFAPVYPPNLEDNDIYGPTYVSYFRDATHVWYDKIQSMNVIAGADAATFAVLTSQPDDYAKDKNQVYTQGTVLAGADPSFALLNSIYEKDATHVYINGQVISGADPTTFMVIPKSEQSDASPADASDKNHQYLGGQRIDYEPGDIVGAFTVASIDRQSAPFYISGITFVGTTTVRGIYRNENSTDDMCGGLSFDVDNSEQGVLPDGSMGFFLIDTPATEQALASYDGKEVTIEISGYFENRVGKDCAGDDADFVQVVQ